MSARPTRITIGNLTILFLFVAFGGLSGSLHGCDDDGPLAPPALPSLAGADSVLVTFHALGAFEHSDGTTSLEWTDIGTRWAGGSYDADSLLFHADQIIEWQLVRERDAIDLFFDPSTGAIDSLHCESTHAEPGYRWGQSVIARDIPLFSYERKDGRLKAVWRISGPHACTVVDAATSWVASRFYSSSMLLWSCTGEEKAYLEIQLTN